MKTNNKITFLLLYVIGQSTAFFGQQPTNFAFERVYVEAGIQLPIGSLKTKINAAPNLGFWYKTQLKTHEYIDFGFNISYQNSSKDFVFEKNDSIFRNRPKGGSGMVGFRYGKELRLSPTKNITATLFPSFGYGFMLLQSDLIGLKNGRTSDPKRSAVALSTIHIGQGLNIKVNNVGLHAQYQFTPYHLFYDYIDRDFGSHSFVFGIFYRQ